jgi:hypothetical protein
VSTRRTPPYPHGFTPAREEGIRTDRVRQNSPRSVRASRSPGPLIPIPAVGLSTPAGAPLIGEPSPQASTATMALRIRFDFGRETDGSLGVSPSNSQQCPLRGSTSVVPPRSETDLGPWCVGSAPGAFSFRAMPPRESNLTKFPKPLNLIQLRNSSFGVSFIPSPGLRSHPTNCPAGRAGGSPGWKPCPAYSILAS